MKHLHTFIAEKHSNGIVLTDDVKVSDRMMNGTLQFIPPTEVIPIVGEIFNQVGSDVMEQFENIINHSTAEAFISASTITTKDSGLVIQAVMCMRFDRRDMLIDGKVENVLYITRTLNLIEVDEMDAFMKSLGKMRHH